MQKILTHLEFQWNLFPKYMPISILMDVYGHENSRDYTVILVDWEHLSESPLSRSFVTTYKDFLVLAISIIHNLRHIQ